jgi:transcriptional regulator with XRE-family HTH domain
MRQLAHRSGVDHTTISRLARGDRVPSFDTAAKIVRSLRQAHDEADTAHYLGVMAAASSNPEARVEHAVRADDVLGEQDVRLLMEYYVALRTRRLAVGRGPQVATVRSVAVRKDN